MTHTAFLAATQLLAQHLLGPAAIAHLALLNNPVMSAAQPALRFRIGLQCPGLTATEIITTLAARVEITGAPDSLPVLRAAERAIATGCNSLREWGGLGMGLAQLLTDSLTPSADSDILTFDFRCQPSDYT